MSGNEFGQLGRDGRRVSVGRDLRVVCHAISMWRRRAGGREPERRRRVRRAGRGRCARPINR
jgi:hypothetical protein